MRRFIVLALPAVLVTLCFASPARASDVGVKKKFGIGGMLGAPTGLSMKYFIKPKHALDFGVGFGWFGHAALYIHADYKFHITLTKKPKPFELLLYFGGGLKLFLWFNDHERKYWLGHKRESYVGLGIRIPIGIAFHLNKIPLDIFFEVVPGIGLFPGFGMFLDGAIGVRYYF